MCAAGTPPSFTIHHSSFTKQSKCCFFLPQHVFDLLNILLGKFGVVEALQAAIWEIDLGHAAASQRDDGAELLHHVDIVQPS